MTQTVVIRPQAGPQETFLSCSADIVIYGGSAGGGKTFGLLLDPLRYVNNKNFGFVIFRRTSPQIKNEGGLWDESKKLYPFTGAEGLSGISTWRWPSGAKGVFRHLQHEDTVLDWQGSQIPYIGFDELNHFSEGQFFYMLSRNRSVSGVRPCVRATVNPSPGWLKNFLAPWLDRSHPFRADSGEIRHFIRRDGQVQWVRANYVDADGQAPKSVAFVRSSIFDNKILLEANPEYLTNLKSLPYIEQQRLLYGNWDVFEGAYFDEWDEAKHTCPARDIPAHWDTFGGLDYGTAAPFAFGLFASTEDGNIEMFGEVYEKGLLPEEQARLCVALMKAKGVNIGRTLIAADPSMFPPKDPAKRLGEYPIEAFWRAGMNCVPAVNDRIAGWTRVKEWLHKPGGFKIHKGSCPNTIRTFPLQVYDERPGHEEDLDTTQEDHAVEIVRYAEMTRPSPSKSLLTEEQKEAQWQEEWRRSQLARMAGHTQRQNGGWKV